MEASTTSLVAVLLLGLVLSLPGRETRRRRAAEAWTMAATGTSVAYVFVVLFPELAHLQAVFLEQRAGAHRSWLHEQVFLLALAGLLLLGGARQWAEQQEALHTGSRAPFVLELGVLALVHAFVGFTLTEAARAGVVALALTTLGYGTHLVVESRSLRQHWAGLYRRTGRWVVLMCLLGGWAAGARWGREGTLLAAAYALVSGSIVASAMRPELPVGRRGDLLAFLAGAVAFTVLVLCTYRLVRT